MGSFGNLDFFRTSTLHRAPQVRCLGPQFFFPLHHEGGKDRHVGVIRLAGQPFRQKAVQCRRQQGGVDAERSYGVLLDISSSLINYRVMRTIFKRPFSQYVKKARKPPQLAIEDAVEQVCEIPDIGELKQGDLAGIRVYKFKFQRQEYLLAYQPTLDKRGHPVPIGLAPG